MTKYDDNYKWIKVKQFKFDPDLSWEANFHRLEAHHQEETEFLIEEIKRLARLLEKDSQ